MAVVILFADTLSNAAHSEKANKRIDDPDPDVHLEMLLINHNAGHVLKFV